MDQKVRLNCDRYISYKCIVPPKSRKVHIKVTSPKACDDIDTLQHKVEVTILGDYYHGRPAFILLLVVLLFRVIVAVQKVVTESNRLVIYHVGGKPV